MGLDKKQVFGCFKTEKENWKMKRFNTLVLVALIAVIGSAFVGCDNGSTSNNEVRVVAPEFRGRFEHTQYNFIWFELTETTILAPHDVGNDPAPAWTVGDELWIFTFDTDHRAGVFLQGGNNFSSPPGHLGWGAFTRATD